jgi:chromosome partitioning protein
MARIISLFSSKGGTGKTTTALNLGMALADLGLNTCIVDLDPIGSIGSSLAKSDTEWQGLAEVFLKKIDIQQAIIKSKVPTLSILPRGRLDPVDACTYESFLFETNLLQSVMMDIKDNYQYIILDIPSGIGMIPRAALNISNYVIVTLQAEPLALRTLSQSLKVASYVTENENTDLKLLGILPTMVDVNQKESIGILKVLWGNFKGVFKTYIPRSNIFLKSSEKGIPATFMTGPNSVDAQRYTMLAREVVQICWEIEENTGDSYDEPERSLF